MNDIDGGQHPEAEDDGDGDNGDNDDEAEQQPLSSEEEDGNGNDDDDDDDDDDDAAVPAAPLIPRVPSSTIHASDGRYQNKQRLLVLSSRGVTARYRHLLEDLRTLLPHSKKESKLDVGESVLNCYCISSERARERIASTIFS